MKNVLLTSLRKLVRSRTIWALGDQGMVSVGNFAVNIILARSVPIADFGIYALAFGVFLVLNGLHGSFVCYPLTIRVAKEGAREVPRLVGLALVLTALLVPLLGIGVAVLFVLVDRPFLIPMALFAFAAWRFQDVLRRALMSQLKYRAAIPGDAISYLGQAVVMLGLAHFDMLTLEAVFLVIGATSAAAAVVQALQVRVRFSRPAALIPFVRDCWDLGRWTVSRTVISVGQMQGVGWVLAAVHGVEATAHFRAAVNVFGVTHPIMMGIGNLVTPSVAHAHRVSMREVMRITLQLGLQGAVLVIPYFVFLACVPDFALDVFYGHGSPYREIGGIVTIMAAGYTIAYVARMISGTLHGLAKPALAFHAQLWGTLTAVFAAMPLAAWGGVFYAAVGTTLAQAILLIANAVYLRREVIREFREVTVPSTVRDAQ